MHLISVAGLSSRPSDGQVIGKTEVVQFSRAVIILMSIIRMNRLFMTVMKMGLTYSAAFELQ